MLKVGLALGTIYALDKPFPFQTWHCPCWEWTLLLGVLHHYFSWREAPPILIVDFSSPIVLMWRMVVALGLATTFAEDRFYLIKIGRLPFWEWSLLLHWDWALVMLSVEFSHLGLDTIYDEGGFFPSGNGHLLTTQNKDCSLSLLSPFSYLWAQISCCSWWFEACCSWE